jgi:hypothetical protein
MSACRVGVSGAGDAAAITRDGGRGGHAVGVGSSGDGVAAVRWRTKGIRGVKSLMLFYMCFGIIRAVVESIL